MTDEEMIKIVKVANAAARPGFAALYGLLALGTELRARGLIDADGLTASAALINAELREAEVEFGPAWTAPTRALLDRWSCD